MCTTGLSVYQCFSIEVLGFEVRRYYLARKGVCLAETAVSLEFLEAPHPSTLTSLLSSLLQHTKAPRGLIPACRVLSLTLLKLVWRS